MQTKKLEQEETGQQKVCHDTAWSTINYSQPAETACPCNDDTNEPEESNQEIWQKLNDTLLKQLSQLHE